MKKLNAYYDVTLWNNSKNIYFGDKVGTNWTFLN